MGWQVIISGIFAFFLLLFTGFPPRSMWLFALVSMILEAVYFILLSNAYSDHDFSLVYPIARGTAPAFLMLWSILFLHETLTTWRHVGDRDDRGRDGDHWRHQPDPEPGEQASHKRSAHCTVGCPDHFAVHPDRRHSSQERPAAAICLDDVHARPLFHHHLQYPPLRLETVRARPGMDRACPCSLLRSWELSPTCWL